MRMPKHLLVISLLGCGGSNALRAEIPPSEQEMPSDPRPAGASIEREDLGVPTLVEQRSESDLITIRVVFDVGSAEDLSGREGITRLAAQLRVEGGAGDRSYRQVEEALYPMAGSLSVSGDRQQTAFIGRVHRERIEDFYAVFRDVLRSPRLEEAAFNRLRSQFESELTLSLRGTDDEELGKELLQSMIFEGHPFGHPVVGTEAGLHAISLDEVRAHSRTMFCGARATVGLAGNYPADLATRLLADVQALDHDDCLGRRVLPTVSSPGVRLWAVDKADSRTVAISLGFASDVTRDHEDFAAMTLAAAWLGQHRTFAGKLMKELRGVRGFNYGDYAYADHFQQEGWSRFPAVHTSRTQQYFSVWLRPVARENAHFALRYAVHTLQQALAVGISDAEFTAIRNFITGYFSLYGQTESRRLGFAIDDRFYGLESDHLADLRTQWSNLTAEQVNAAMRRHFRMNDLQIALVTADAQALVDEVVADAPSAPHYQNPIAEAEAARDEVIARLPLGIRPSQARVIPVRAVFQQ